MTNGPDGALPVSGLQELMAWGSGGGLAQYASMAAAQSDPDAAVVLTGDDGGTVLLTTPLRLMRCDLPTLRQLAVDLDKRLWDDPTGVEVAILRLPVGCSVAGGMGGGVIKDGVWVHRRLGEGVAERAEAVLLGISARLASE